MPAKKPFLLKESEGNRGHRPLEPGIQPPSGPMIPTCDLDAVARAEWDRIIGVAFWLKPTEAGILSLRCMAWSRFMAAEADITKRGHVVKTRNGKVKNPSIQISRDYRTTVMQCDARLGLTVLDRERVTTGPDTVPHDSVDAALCG